LHADLEAFQRDFCPGNRFWALPIRCRMKLSSPGAADARWRRVTVDGDTVRRVTMIFSSMRRAAVAAALVTAVGLLSVVPAASATGSGQPQRRQFAASTLSDFKVVLTATREPGHRLLATVTAAGYRRSGSHWKLIARKRIGKTSGWFWFSVQTCALTATQLKNNAVSPSPPVVRFDSIKVSLLITPAIGCSRTYSKRWT